MTTDPLARLSGAAKRTRVPAAVRAAVFRRDKDRCVHCGAKERLGLDHIKPVSKGGDDTYDNLRVLCASCNTWKGNREDEKYLRPLPPDSQRLLDEVVRTRTGQLDAEREYIEAIVDARKHGHSYAEIARVLGVSRQAVRQLLLSR